MNDLIEGATLEQLKIALIEALVVIDQLSASNSAYIREDIVEKIKEAHLESIANKLGGSFL